jgi:hypothetical protein
VPRVRRLATVALLGLALALAACGAGGDDNKTARTPLTTAQYRAKLTAICRQAVGDARALGSPTGANSSAFADYFERNARLERARQRPFEAIVPPAQLNDEHDRLARLRADALDALDESVSAFRGGGDLRAVFERLRRRLNAVVRRSNRIVAKLNLPLCRAQLIPPAGSS